MEVIIFIISLISIFISLISTIRVFYIIRKLTIEERRNRIRDQERYRTNTPEKVREYQEWHERNLKWMLEMKEEREKENKYITKVKIL